MNRNRMLFAIATSLMIGNALMLDRYHALSIIVSLIGIAAGVYSMVGFYARGIK